MGRSMILLVAIVTFVTTAECTVTTFEFSGSDSTQLHNAKRALHQNTNPLTASDHLKDAAKNCAKNILEKGWDARRHPCNPGSDGQGENIYKAKAYSSPQLGLAVNGWYAEIKHIDFDDRDWAFGAQALKVGHVTQLLWRGTTQVGCAGAKKRINRYGKNEIIIVCRYSPQGNNYQTRSLENNVKPQKKKPVVDCEDMSAFPCGSFKVKDCTIGPYQQLIRYSCKKMCGC